MLHRRAGTLPRALVIPHVVHRIWLGPDPLPEEFRRYGETWARHHPEWEMRLWTDEDIRGSQWEEMLARGRHQAERSDVLRYHLLCRHGGVYVDTDFECLRSIEPLLEGLEAFSAYLKPGRTNIAIMGFAPHHPVMERAAREAGVSIGTGDAKYATGPMLVDGILESFPDVRIFEPEVFYAEPSTASLEELEQAYALHHASRTWKTLEDLKAEVDKWRSRRIDDQRKHRGALERAERRTEKAAARLAAADGRLAQMERSAWWRLGLALRLARPPRRHAPATSDEGGREP